MENLIDLLKNSQPKKIIYFGDESKEKTNEFISSINKSKLETYSFFEKRTEVFIVDNFDNKNLLNDYNSIRNHWDKVVDILLLNKDGYKFVIQEEYDNEVDLVVIENSSLSADELEIKFEKITNLSNVLVSTENYENISNHITNEDTVESADNIFDTQKVHNGYINFYLPFFQKITNPKNILEIGIHEGKSLKLLSHYFPTSVIHGIDFDDCSKLNSEKIKTYVGNQENREDLKKITEYIGEKFDVIIDDGGHMMKGQQISLGYLFNKLEDGGIYIIENLQTSRLPQLGTVTNNDIITTLDMLYNFKSTKKIISNHISEEEKNYLQDKIDDIQIWSQTPEQNLTVTCVIRKKIGFADYSNKLVNMKNFDIAITTFSLRFDFLNDLVSKIRNMGITNNILICVNGEKNGNFDESYRKNILSLCLSHNNVYPIFFIEVRGLSKMWNTCIVHSPNEDVLILNDDIILNTDDIFKTVLNHINSSDYGGLTKINNTFSYFVTNKKVINNLGYFDERLLGFGEEDGDITFRFHESYNKEIQNIWTNGVQNIVSDIRHEFITPGVGKYSLFNRKFMFEEKYLRHDSELEFRGMFDYPCFKNLEDINLYPYEKFFLENKNLL